VLFLKWERKVVAEAFNSAGVNNDMNETSCYEDNNHFSWVSALIHKMERENKDCKIAHLLATGSSQ
jgi:hypothetical protein